MKTLSMIVCSCFLGALSGLAQNAGAAQTGDQAFVTLAAQTDMTEANLGQAAADRATSQAVKDYAQMLVTDHTNDYNQLSLVAAKAGLMVPNGIDAGHQKTIALYENLKGAAFDRRFAHDMVLGHEAAIAAYDKESRDGQNSDLKAYAKQALPTLEKHRDAAKQLKKPGK